MFDIRKHQTELTRTLRGAYKDIEASFSTPKKMYPPRFSSFLWHQLRQLPIPSHMSLNDQPSQAIRKIHDFYGWKAKDTARERGHCAGALYRTGSFMALASEERVGTKGESRTIHIEHSVPIGVLMNWLRHSSPKFKCPVDLHNFLMNYSVITAFSHEEEKDMQGTVHASRHPGFQKTGMISGEYPFLRYRPLQQKNKQFRIYNVVTAEEIDVETFTYDDHKRTLIEASKRCCIPFSHALGIYDGNLFGYNAWFNIRESNPLGS